jgi:hypothetical protein
VRIAPRMSIAARALDVVAPGAISRVMKRQRLQPN